MNLDLYWAEFIVLNLTYIKNVWMLSIVIDKSLLTFVLSRLLMFSKVRKTVIYHALKAKFIDDVNSK